MQSYTPDRIILSASLVKEATAQQKRALLKSAELLRNLVGMRGFEPPTTCTPCRYASQAALHPVNNVRNISIVLHFCQGHKFLLQ